MTEIKLDADKHDIHDLIRYLDGDHHMGVCDRAMVVKDLKAQLPKPVIEEPFEFGSVVRTRTEGLFVRLGAAMALPWGSGGTLRAWDHLDVVEVLRVGIGQPQTHNAALSNLLNEIHYLVQAWESIPAQRVHDLITAYGIDAASEDPS